MRKLRWLAIALAVMAAPAVWVFVSDMYFLGFAEDDRRKEHLLSEIGYAHDRSRFNAGLYDGGQFLVEKDKTLLLEPSLWELIRACEGADRKVDLLDLNELSLRQQVGAHSIFRQTQRTYRSITWIFPASLTVNARSKSNIGLAALNACYRATPFYQMCEEAYLNDIPSEQKVAEVLVERGILDRVEGGYCWSKDTFSISEGEYSSNL